MEERFLNLWMVGGGWWIEPNVNRLPVGPLRTIMGNGMRSASNHRELVAWQEAILLVETVFRETAKFPREEVFGLATQLRRSAISIPSNIAEGAGRNTTRELAHFLGIASGSRSELDAQLVVAQRLGLIEVGSPVFGQLERVGKLLTAPKSGSPGKAKRRRGLGYPQPTTHNPRFRRHEFTFEFVPKIMIFKHISLDGISGLGYHHGVL